MWRPVIKRWVDKHHLQCRCFLLCAMGLAILCYQFFYPGKHQVLLATDSRLQNPPASPFLLSFFFLFFFFFSYPPPFPFESVNERMSKAREVWKDFIPREVRVGWKAEGAARGQFENRKPCGSVHAGPS